MIKSVTEARIYHEVASLRDSSLLGPSVCSAGLLVCCLLSAGSSAGLSRN